MTQRTDTIIDRTTKWGLFRFDADVFDETTVFQENWYGTELDAKKALDTLNNTLPLFLKKLVIIKEVFVSPADRKKFNSYASPT